MDAKCSASVLRKQYPHTRPAVLTRGPIIGLGYRPPWRIGNIVQARFAAKHKLNVMLAQQSAREIERTGRSFRDVIDSGSTSAFEAGLKIPWGADGDHLRNAKEAAAAASAGCTHFTYDVTAELKDGLEAIVEKIAQLYAVTREIRGAEAFTTEISLDEGSETTKVEDVVELISALKTRKIAVNEIAPRFPGYFEKAIDYYLEMKDGKRIRDTDVFERYLSKIGAAALRHDFRVCVHSGSDKFSIYPIIARVLQRNFHLKTAGTYYLEDLKIVARHDLSLFRDIFSFSLAQFEKDRASYELSADTSKIPDVLNLEGCVIARHLQSGSGSDDLRQVLHVTYGSVLTARGKDGKALFADAMEKTLRENAKDYDAELTAHLDRHFKWFYS